MTKEIKIDDKLIPFKASAAIPRIYRIKFNRDIFEDLTKLMKDVKDGDADNSAIGISSLECFENIAYVMAKHADNSVPDDPTEWLDQFNTFSIYQVLPQIIELWGMNTKTIAVAKKK